MLKWTFSRKPSESETRVLPHLASDICSSKRHDGVGSVVARTRRRSSNTRRRSISRKSTSPFCSNKKNRDVEKENCFTSTPIKSSESHYHHEVLRDVSNLSPKRANPKKRCHEQPDIFSKYTKSPFSERKRKKKCVDKAHYLRVDSSPFSFKNSLQKTYFEPFEPVEFRNAVKINGACGCENVAFPSSARKADRNNYYAPTLPTFEVEDSPSFIPTNYNLNVAHRKSCPSRLSLSLGTLPLIPPGEVRVESFRKKFKVGEASADVRELLDTSFSDSEVDKIRSKISGGSKITVSPLVKRFVDLRFSAISYEEDENVKKTPFSGDDSSYINDLSLDKIVDAILETTTENDADSKENISVIVHLDPKLQERDNEFNETREENLINIEHEKQISATVSSSCDKKSFDSGFGSTITKQYHDVGINFTCKCSGDEIEIPPFLQKAKSCDKTIIDLNNTFNERCVDFDSRIRKRSRSALDESEPHSERLNWEDKSGHSVKDFTLKRQKCVKRRRGKLSDAKFVEHAAAAARLASSNCDVQLDRSNRKPIDADLIDKFERQRYDSAPFEISENSVGDGDVNLNPNLIGRVDSSNGDDDIANSLNDFRPSCHRSRTRRCLSFETSNSDEKASSAGENSLTLKSDNADINGSMDLELAYRNNEIVLKVLNCKDLSRSGNVGQVNAYVKVLLIDRICDRFKKKNSVLHRTAVHANSCKPTFNHTFRLPICKQDISKRLQIEVWHRDRSCRRSEFLGCMSFPVKNVVKRDINGSYRLLPQSTGRCQNAPIARQNSFSLDIDANIEAEGLAKMCDNQADKLENAMSIDDFDVDFKKTSNPAILNQHQKDADENLFLRYLELDPMEGPEAIPAATQRKATGNKNGRTPFTTTKKLVRAPKSGFGFSVVWTHPPRIERVEKGLPADRAGILPGDYIIFVDKHNVVTMPEIDILNLIKSLGNQITLEVYRKHASRHNSTMSVARPVSANSSGLPATSAPIHHRPSTIGSVTTATANDSTTRRRLNLPQVTFCAEKQTLSTDEARKKAMYQILSKEQHYASTLQFAITRFVSALAERSDLITPSDHRVLFQNCEEILQITEDLLDSILQEDLESLLFLKTYHLKLHEIVSAYKRYCSGIKKADCILLNKTRNSNSEFVRFLQAPAIPRRRPDITAFIHKPLEHYREILKLFNVILSSTKPNQEQYALASRIVQELQIAYREMTAEAGLMEPIGEGRPLLSVQDIESRMVFTKCKPFVLSKPGRQWIFGGDLTRVEGRCFKQYWTLLFNDLILFAKVSRDRVLFITEDPLPLTDVRDLIFNVRKKATEFRLLVSPNGGMAKSPTVHCGPDLTRTPKKSVGKRCIVLRAPNTELKAVWQNLLQRQIFQVNAGMDYSSFSSPLDSPEAPITSSVVTLQSADSMSIRRQNQRYLNESQVSESQKQIDEIIEHKCKQLERCSSSSKGNAIHLEQWMKGQLGPGMQTPEEEPECELWTDEMLRKRTQELQLADNRTVQKCGEKGCDEFLISDQSPSKSTSPESQVTVRSSPIAPENVPVCKKCHKTCLTNSNGNSPNFHNSNNNVDHSKCVNGSAVKYILTRQENVFNNNNSREAGDILCDDFETIMLMGLSAVNPAAKLVKLDPFSPIPKISVVPPTPNLGSELIYNESKISKNSILINDLACNEFKINNNQSEISPDDSPQDEEQPYHSLSSSNLTLRRFGTVSSLERLESEEGEEKNYSISSDSEEELGIDNQAFTSSTANQGWTARAGAFVSEKMAFFEKLGEDYRTGFFEKYLGSSKKEHDAGEEECENSGATSGEEIWGTPTSGDLDDPLSPTIYDGRCSPSGSLSSDNDEDTELMMDELLMTPPVASNALRGLLPRRTLEPLMEEDSDTCMSTTSSSTSTEVTTPPKQGNGTGDVADTCSTAVADIETNQGPIPSITHAIASPAKSTTPRILRSDSYRHIIEAEDDNVHFFNRFKSSAKINIERIPRSKSVKLFQIFYVKKERKIHETYPECSPIVKAFNKEGVSSDEVPTAYSQKPISPRKPKDKQMDGRFWRQLSRRRGNKKSN